MNETRLTGVPPALQTVIGIDSIDDERIALYRDVRNAELRGRRELFIAESELVVRRLIESRFQVHSLLLSPAKHHRLADAVRRLPASTPVYIAHTPLLTQIAGYRIHGGALGLGVRPRDDEMTMDAALRPILGQPRALLVLAERITHVDNVGSLFRNAAAFGADAVVLDAACADPLFRKAIRVSVGQTLSMPFAIARDWTAAMESLRRQWGMTIIAAESAVQSRPIADSTRIERVAVVFGSERHGIKESTLALCDGVYYIAMSRGVPSINVATAAAIILRELAARSRY